jgi:hypothetical protein
MDKVIIGIHGLGNKPPKNLLQKWWKDAMLEGLSLTGVNKKLPSFEIVYWADIVYKNPLNKWTRNKNDPYYLDEPYKKAPNTFVVEDHSLRRRVIDFLTKQMNRLFLNKDKTMKYSFLADAIIKRYFKDLEVYYMKEYKNNVSSKAQNLIRERVVQTIKKYDNHEIMIIAHSMGSIIIFDVLNFLIPEIKINTLVTMGSPLGLPIVIHKIATEQKKRFNGKSILATPPGITTNWFNFADIMDHVALNYKLADDFSKNERGILPTDFLVNNNYEINGVKNPHKSFGYLRAPEFSKILSNFIEEEKHKIGQKVLGKVKDVIEKVKEHRQKMKDKSIINQNE